MSAKEYAVVVPFEYIATLEVFLREYVSAMDAKQEAGIEMTEEQRGHYAQFRVGLDNIEAVKKDPRARSWVVSAI